MPHLLQTYTPILSVEFAPHLAIYWVYPAWYLNPSTTMDWVFMDIRVRLLNPIYLFPSPIIYWLLKRCNADSELPSSLVYILITITCLINIQPLFGCYFSTSPVACNSVRKDNSPGQMMYFCLSIIILHYFLFFNHLWDI